MCIRDRGSIASKNFLDYAIIAELYLVNGPTTRSYTRFLPRPNRRRPEPGFIGLCNWTSWPPARYLEPHAPVAQLDRASDFESEGREFESLRARQQHQI